MGSLNVNMPNDLREYVDERTKKGGFGTPTEYVRHIRVLHSARDVPRVLRGS